MHETTTLQHGIVPYYFTFIDSCHHFHRLISCHTQYMCEQKTVFRTKAQTSQTTIMEKDGTEKHT